MRIDDIIRASLKALEEGESRKTNTNIVTRGALVLPADLLSEDSANTLPSEDPRASSAPEKTEDPLLYDAQDTPLDGALRLQVTLGASQSRNNSRWWGVICKEMANELESANTAAIFELSSQKLKSIFFHEEYERLFSSALVNAAITGLILRLCIEQPLSRVLRDNQAHDEQVEEFFFFFAGMYCFVSLVPERDVALVLIMNEKSQQGRSWFALREATQRLLVGEDI